NRLELLHLSVPAQEALGGDRIVPDPSLFMGPRSAKDVGPLRPGVRSGSLSGRPRQGLELVDRAGAPAVHGSKTVRPRVPSAPEVDPAFIPRCDELVIRDVISLTGGFLHREKLKGHVDPLEPAPRHRKIAAVRGPAAKHNRLVTRAQGAHGGAPAGTRADIRF